MKYFLCLFLLLFSYRVQAQSLPDSDSLFHRFVDHLDTVSATFHQQKTVLGMTRRGKSDGHVFFRKGTGFIWEQRNPSYSRFAATKTHWCQDQGTPKKLSDLPYFRSVQSMIDTLLSGDFSQLTDWFDPAYLEKGDQWFLTLTPARDDLADWVAMIELTGTASALTRLVFHQADGSVISIQFAIDTQEVPDDMGC